MPGALARGLCSARPLFSLVEVCERLSPAADSLLVDSFAVRNSDRVPPGNVSGRRSTQFPFPGAVLVSNPINSPVPGFTTRELRCASICNRPQRPAMAMETPWVVLLCGE